MREKFEDAITKARLENNQVRVVGGYDPVKKEYLVTIIDNLVVLTTSNPTIVDQPSDAVVAPSDDIFQEDIIVGPAEPPATDDFQAGFQAGLAAAGGSNLNDASAQELVNQLRYVTGFTAQQLNQLRALASNLINSDFTGAEGVPDGAVGTPDLLAFLTSFNQSYVPEEEIIQPIDPPTPSEEDPVEEIIDEGDGVDEGEDDGEGEENGDGFEDDAGGGAD